ncbi:hypothetical protein [Geobacillus thermoleovorans]|uniref:hypothetical protein n=1 Tax=Geobacillus thermoleovorans TaxID=33941 RepID=UPI0010FDF4D0|nr:hypothetical protein [Geobacillus thermoleovorans]TLS32337.1 hypothetical protein FDK15_14065 [Geobacillus thermoleovorans]
MVLFDIKHRLYYEAINSARPKMAPIRQDRAWGYVWKTVNGERVKFWIDFQRGQYLYFEYGRKWYRVKYLQANGRKSGEDILNGAMIDLTVDGHRLLFMKGRVGRETAQVV